jgi:OOP family OmpA-OmpF porin
MKKIILSTVACATMMLAANPDYKYEITPTIGGVYSEGNLGLDRVSCDGRSQRWKLS